MDALTRSPIQTHWSPQWPQPDRSKMARDFLVWRHLRVVRARLMRHVHLRAGPRFSDGLRTVYGVKMVPNWEDRTYAYCHYGTYGPYLAGLIGSLDAPFVFLDIGANQGLFSLIAGQNPNCEAIVALEPVPDTFARLQANFALNGLDARGLALNFGLSDEDSTRTIAIKGEHSGAATLESHLGETIESVEQQPVDVRTMESLAQHLPADFPIFIKIDVEGHEPTVIDQLLAWPEAHRILGIFYEHDERWSSGEAIGALFAKAGFAMLHKYGRGRHFDALAVPRRSDTAA